ncbi:MAG: helix-turn-helix transcriptional regulator [Sphingobacterium sp.]|jgi:AraC-like DNA-binding protein|uniref:helix-turn-helix domain-containing protein n=1 Tax=Sphingobacterium sp. TaxID=341027 RepID=UPI00284E7839|nr:helix-turn-helix transcriptional regulator [Sphingobacterium sp.]MDR3006858.1 helix-turn-helix transcriptional regulator [Sphingobacterium sp.]
MENSILIDQFLQLQDCRVEITGRAPDYAAFTLLATPRETLRCAEGRLSRQSRKLIGAHLQLIEAQLYADLTIPFTVTVPSYFLYVQLRGATRFYTEQGALLPCPDQPYLSLCYYPPGDYAPQLGHGLHSFAIIALEEEWFADLGEHYPAFSPLTEARAIGTTACYRLAPVLLNKMILDLLDDIRFTAIRGLQDSARVVQLLGKVVQHYHEVAFSAAAAAGQNSEALRLALDSYLEEHYMDEQRSSIQQIKKSLGWKRHNAEQVAKDSLGCTLRRYVVEFRISKACILLVETNAKIADIAYQTGFSSQSSFTKSFKHAMGIQPSAYRQKNS